MDSSEPDAKTRSDAVTARVSLVDLRLRRVSANLLQINPKLDLELWPKVEPAMTVFDEYVAYDISYELLAQDAKGRRAVEVEATFTVIFELDAELASQDLEAFGSIGVLTVVHPYARELFHNLTGRMGIPPLLLEVMPPEPASLAS